jgi:hypothetical protein
MILKSGAVAACALLLVPQMRITQEVAFLRRQHGVIIATSTDLRATAFRTLDARLVVTRRADTVVRVTRTHWTRGAPLVLVDSIASLPGVARVILGTESSSRNATPGAGEARLDIDPPPPLAGFTGTAISDPVLLVAPMEGELSSETARALAVMAPSATVAVGSSIGVYWETYGLSPFDSVDIAVWIERTTVQSRLRRLAVSLNIAANLNAPVVVRWSESRAARSAYVIGGRVPIVARSLVLDASKLIKGDYRLEIAVKSPAWDAIRSYKNITVQ